MTDPDSVGEVRVRGVPDVLVSTPSVNVRKPVLEITDDEFDQIVELNLKGTFRLIRTSDAAWPSAARAASSPSRASGDRWSNRDRGSTQRRSQGRRCRCPLLRSRTPRCQGQRHSAWHRRDAFDGPDQRVPRLVRLLRSQEHPGPLGHAARDGRDGPLPRLGSQLLRHGRLHAGRRRLDRRGRAFHATTISVDAVSLPLGTISCASQSPLASDITIRHSRVSGNALGGLRISSQRRSTGLRMTQLHADSAARI